MGGAVITNYTCSNQGDCGGVARCTSPSRPASKALVADSRERSASRCRDRVEFPAAEMLAAVTEL